MAVAPPPPPSSSNAVIRDGAFYDALGDEALAMAERMKAIAGELKNAGQVIDDQ